MASLFRRTLFATTRAHLRPQPTPTRALLPLLPSFRQLSTETRATIDSIISTAPVVLFMKGTPDIPQCGFSKASIQILGLQGVDPDKFAAYNVLEDEEIRQGIKEYSNWPTIPQLYVNGEFIGGCDILVAMHQSGELAEMLEKEGVLAPEEAVEESAEGKSEGEGDKKE
ncbi:glutaredoxin [Ascodesmis nigricans]|uniref:Monothiol glutaredoxin-5, mitochondrial n=1 Tax=Ascodesmis nigricans TaxID=341454 RepID=A0A4S2N286_9PEZI|nr:glutaredoxin [Ascodesmis nigricans]